MAFIKKNIESLVHTKITDYGRKKMSETTLPQIKYFQVGDSEINYKRDIKIRRNDQTRNFNVLRAKDNDSVIKYPIPMEILGCDTFGLVKPAHRQFDVEDQVHYGVTRENEINIPEYAICLPKNILNGTNKLVSVTNITCEYILIYLGEYENNRLISPDLMLWYKIIDFDGTNTYTLDRNLPDFSYITDTGIQIYVLPYSPNENINVWDFNIIRKKPLIGENNALDLNMSYGADFSGIFNELGYNYTDNEDDCGNSNNFKILDVSENVYISELTFNHVDSFGNEIKTDVRDLDMLGVIHYSKVGNYYGTGEWWNVNNDDFMVNLPSVIFTKEDGTSMGLKLIADKKEYMLFNDPDMGGLDVYGNKFHYLTTLEGVFVGKIFVDKQIIIIEDQELLMSLSYKSNRNFTLPEHKLFKQPINIVANNITEESVLLPREGDVVVYMTYMFYNEMNKIYYYPQTFVKKLNTEVDDDYDIAFSLGNDLDLLDEQVVVNKVYALVQRVTDGQLKSNQWRMVDVTAKLNNMTTDRVLSENILNVRIPISYEDFINAPFFNLQNTIGYPSIGEEENLLTGDEFMLFGDIKLTGGHTTYESNFEVKITKGQFLKSLNPTWSEGQNLYISEVGLYDLNKKLVSISKISIPIERDLSNNGEETVFSIKLDF